MSVRSRPPRAGVARSARPALARLARRYRAQTRRATEAWARGALSALPVRDAPLTREVAIVSRGLDLSHEDPADRLIAASAVVHDVTLVTADNRPLGSSSYQVLAGPPL